MSHGLTHFCRECGVLVPAGGSDDLQVHAQKQQQPHDLSHLSNVVERSSPAVGLQAVFEGRVPVPMEWPGREFVPAGGASVPGGAAAAASAARLTPWFYGER